MVPRAQTCVQQVEMMDRMCAFRGAVPEIERNWLAFESLSEKTVKEHQTRSWTMAGDTAQKEQKTVPVTK